MCLLCPSPKMERDLFQRGGPWCLSVCVCVCLCVCVCVTFKLDFLRNYWADLNQTWTHAWIWWGILCIKISRLAMHAKCWISKTVLPALSHDNCRNIGAKTLNFLHNVSQTIATNPIVFGGYRSTGSALTSASGISPKFKIELERWNLVCSIIGNVIAHAQNIVALPSLKMRHFRSQSSKSRNFGAQ